MLKVFTGFAGYGGDKFALQLANINYEEVGFSEIDKHAIQCHKQNHKGENFGSITDIDPGSIPDFDLFTGGFPCQAFSIAGKGQGVADEKGRGLLFNEIIRICKVKQPKYILLENVKGLMSKKHSEFFEFTKSELKRIGYNIDVTLYNSKNYGIPQNRERVVYVCIRNDLEFNYTKPEIIKTTKKITTLDEAGNKVPNVPSTGQAKRIYDKNELFPSLNVGWTPLILSDILESNVDEKYFIKSELLKKLVLGINKNTLEIKNATKQGFIIGENGDGISLEHPDSETRRGRVQKQMSATLQCNDSKGVIIHPLGYNKYIDKRVYGVNGVSPAINCYEQYKILLPTLQIRKLTPKECFRLMGFLSDQINLEGISDHQRYKLAGNGWEINLVSKIMQGFLNQEQTKGE